MARGRKPKSTYLRLLQGNPGKRAINPNEPKPPAPSSLDCPAHLMGEARAMWNRRAPMLASLGIVTDADLELLEGACEAYRIYRQAQAELGDSEFLELDANGRLGKNPLLAVVRDYLNLYRGFCSELGLSPSSRTKLGGSPVNDGMDEFLEGAPKRA